MGKWRKYTCAVLCVSLAVCFAGRMDAPENVYASELTNDLIKEKEAEISDAKELKKQLQSSLTDIKKVKEELEQSKESLKLYVEQLDGQLATIQEKIADLKNKIAEKEEEIAQTETELEAAIADQENQYAAMKQRIRFMYEAGDTLYMEMIFSADSFGDMLNKADYVEQLYTYDRKMLEEYQAAKEYAQQVWDKLEEEKSELVAAQHELEEEQEYMEELLEEKKQEYENYSVQIARAKQEAAAYRTRMRGREGKKRNAGGKRRKNESVRKRKQILLLGKVMHPRQVPVPPVRLREEASACHPAEAQPASRSLLMPVSLSATLMLQEEPA